MEKIISKVAALGVSGLVLTAAVSATGLAGAASLTTALCAIGPGGMIGGIATLGVIGLVSEGITEYGFSAIFFGVVRELKRQGESNASIRRKIRRYPVSKSLKRKLYDELDRIG